MRRRVHSGWRSEVLPGNGALRRGKRMHRSVREEADPAVFPQHTDALAAALADDDVEVGQDVCSSSEMASLPRHCARTRSPERPPFGRGSKPLRRGWHTYRPPSPWPRRVAVMARVPVHVPISRTGSSASTSTRLTTRSNGSRRPAVPSRWRSGVSRHRVTGFLSVDGGCSAVERRSNLLVLEECEEVPPHND